MLCSMANSGCLLVSNSGMLPHSLPCPPAFLYLQQVSHPLRGILFYFFFAFRFTRVSGRFPLGGGSERNRIIPGRGPALAPSPRHRRVALRRWLAVLGRDPFGVPPVSRPRRVGERAEPRAVRQAELPARVQRFPCHGAAAVRRRRGVMMDARIKE